VEEILLFDKFFRLSTHALVCEYIAGQNYAMVRGQMAILTSCISSEPRAAHFSPAF